MQDPPSDRWRRLEMVVDAALNLPIGDRAAWLQDTCGDDAQLHADVLAILEAGERPDGFLTPPPAPVLGGRPPVETAAGSPSPPIPMPSRVGPYRLVQVIGQGGMGTVYLAEREEHFEQRVALKVVGRGLHVPDHLIRRFVEERQLLASLEHANIARVLDGGLTEEGLPWFAMEFVEGEPIDRWCDGEYLGIAARLELLCTACDAVAYAHGRRIVHRDLKPTNILIRHDGTVKLLDFGIAKLIAPEDDPATTLTHPAHRLLTPEYASPEQIRGDTASPASDVYSLGVLLHELLTGRRPRRPGQNDGPAGRNLLPPSEVLRREEDRSDPRTLEEIARARRTTPAALRDRLRGPLDAVVLRALAPAPEDRYPTVGDLAGDLRRYLSGVPVRARAPRRRRPWMVGAAVGAVGLAIGAWLLLPRPRPPAGTIPILAVGLIADHSEGTVAGGSSPTADLLATNLARVPFLHVVSSARVYELLGEQGALTSGPGAYSSAARRAGANMLIDGSLYAVGVDSLRLDLRRIDLTSGEVLAAHSIAARDIFTLVDSGTALLARELGGSGPLGTVADVTTHSAAAYRFYQEGLRAYYRGDQGAAQRLFEAALREDSTLAMASYYLSRTRFNGELEYLSLERALRMAAHASDRERLIIQSAWAILTSDPNAIATAETLLTRYPLDLEGPLYAANAYTQAGQFPAAIPLFRRVIVADSLATLANHDTLACTGCDARSQLITAYINMDSVAAADREAEAWTRFEPDRAGAWLKLAQVRSMLLRPQAAVEAYNRAAGIDARLVAQPNFFARNYLAVEDYDRVDRELREIARSGASDRVPDAHWYLTLSLRQQGRFREALTEAIRGYREEPGRSMPDVLRQSFARHHAQVLYELGRFRESAALFDSLAEIPSGFSDSHRARNRVWGLALSANALLALGDTGRIVALIDTVALVGNQSLSVRDRSLHLHLRGLLAVARGDWADAESQFRRAMERPIEYNRSAYELARVLLHLGRPHEAIAILQPVVRGPTEGGRLYLTTTERRALLAEAWDSAGRADSALANYRVVLQAWQHADPLLSRRVARLRDRVRVLEQAPTTPTR